MTEHRSDTANVDGDLINLNDDQIGPWAEMLGVSEIELHAAVEKVGPKVEDVRRFLNQG
jgi:hypothetical protein